MKMILLALTLVLTTGCVYQKTDLTDILKAQAFCQSRGDVKRIKVYADGLERVTCLDGESENLHNIELALQGE